MNVVSKEAHVDTVTENEEVLTCTLVAKVKVATISPV